MQRVLLAVFLCVSYGVRAQTSNSIDASSLPLAASPKSNWKEPSHQAVKEATKITKEKLSCVLKILKTALSEELATAQLRIIEETSQEPHSSFNKILEDEQNKINKEEHEIQTVKSENENAAEKALYERVISKISSALSGPINITNNQNNSEVPNMIPIFRPRQLMPTNSMKQNSIDYSPPPRQALKSRAVYFVPEKIVQTSLSPITNQPMFNIPCQRAADVLDMNIPIPKEAVCSNANIKPNAGPVVEVPKSDPNASPIVEVPKSNILTQIPPPVTWSVNCADSEDTVAMLFKPQNISLMQMYGNLLKKITITVLVPYHMSKLGSK